MMSPPTMAPGTEVSPPRISTGSALSATIESAKLTSRSEERRVGKECRSLCDWSSDVCSSDLDDEPADDGARHRGEPAQDQHRQRLERHDREREAHVEIGRASCRKRV